MEIDFERLLPNRPEDTDIELVEFGECRYPGLVVDGFYRDPDYVRAFATMLRYKAPPSAHPGYSAVASLDLAALISFAWDRIGQWYFPSPEAMRAEGSPSVFFRMERRDDEPQRLAQPRPHVDGYLLGSLVYLNRPEHCRGGTSFFRHTPTGTEALLPRRLMPSRDPHGRAAASWKPDPAVQARMWGHGAQRAYERALDAGLASSYDDYWQLVAYAPGADSGSILGSCGDWELTRVIEMKYNRLLLFPGFLLHSIHSKPEWFGNSPETWRLTQNSAFNWPGTPA